MKKIIIVFVCIFICLLSFSQSLLWEITGKNLKEPSYLYGTVHIQDKRVFSFDSTVTNVFNKCESFAMEILLDNVDMAEMQKSMLMKDNSLDKLLTPAEYAVADSIFKKKMGMSISLFKNMKPFFLSGMITEIELQKLASETMKTSLDMYFLQMAKAANKKCYEVETFADQLKMIDDIDLKEQAKMFYEDLTIPVENHTKAMKILLNCYLTFDWEECFNSLNYENLYDEDYVKEFGKMFEGIFSTQRNHNMTKSLIEIMKTQTCFCAVGALHLLDEEGIIELLRKEGYTVNPIKFSWKNK